MENAVGSLEPGKWADLCLVRVGIAVGDPDLAARQVVASGGPDVTGTWVAGRRVHRVAELIVSEVRDG